MSTNAFERELAEVSSRIARLRADAERLSAAATARTRRRIVALERETASVREGGAAEAEELESRLGDLRTRIELAERSLAVEVSRRRDRFTVAVRAELGSWDTYLERLQASAATRARRAREQAESAISELRRRRIAVDEQLRRAHDDGGSSWKEHRERVAAARDELEKKADDLSAQLH